MNQVIKILGQPNNYKTIINNKEILTITLGETYISRPYKNKSPVYTTITDIIKEDIYVRTHSDSKQENLMNQLIITRKNFIEWFQPFSQ